MDDTRTERRALPGENDWCPAAPLLALLRGRWTASLMYYLGERGPARFGALQRQLVGISPKVLTARLRALERDGMIWRVATDSVPPEVTYGLSETGDEVHAALKSLEAPTRRWLERSTARQ